jgi:hypothetical protein
MRISEYCQQSRLVMLMLRQQLCQHAETESASMLNTIAPFEEIRKGSGLRLI